MIGIITLLLGLTTPAQAEENNSIKWQIGFETGVSYDWNMSFSSAPTFVSGAMLIKTKHGFGLRPHVSAGIGLPTGTRLNREGLMLVKPLTNEWILGVGALAIQADTPSKVIHNAGLNIAITRQHASGWYISTIGAVTIGSPIATLNTGWTF